MKNLKYLVFVVLFISCIGDTIGQFVFPSFERTTQGITFDNQRTIDFGNQSFQVDFYRNQAYEAGLSTSTNPEYYTFMVINPGNNPNANAPLWVWLHGGGQGYFDENGDYQSILNLDEDTWNHEEPFDKLLGGFTARTFVNGQLVDNTLKRRIEEGYRILMVSYSDHDWYSGMGTTYPNNPIAGAEVNGLQATMSAIDYTAANYPTTHAWVHGTSAGAFGAWSVALSYSEEDMPITGFIGDSGGIFENGVDVLDALVETGQLQFHPTWRVEGIEEKVGFLANIDNQAHPEVQIQTYDFRASPGMWTVGLVDPAFGTLSDPIPPAVAAGISNNGIYVMDGLRQAIEGQDNSPHELHFIPNTGHVPTNSAGQTNDLVDDFINKVLATDPPHFGTPNNTNDHSWAPLNRTTCDITLVEEDNISFQSNSVELDFYRNTEYTCGISGNYTFLVVEPLNNPGAEAPLWVYLHGGGAGYYDENQQYNIGVSHVTGLPHANNHNTEKTLEILRDNQLLHNTTTNGGQIESSTLTRRIQEGYRVLIVSMCDHDLHAGMGTPYLNNPNGGEVNGLQANMAAIDYTVANYPTTHVFAHGTSAGSIGAFTLAYAYNLEGIKLNGIIMDSHLASFRTDTLVGSMVGESGFVFPADFDIKEAGKKVGWLADPERFFGIEHAIENGYDIPSLDIYGNLDPGCGGGLARIDEAHSVGLDNCDWVHDGFRQAVAAQPNSIHKVRVTTGFGHVPTNYASPANDFVDEFIGEILATNPVYPFGQSPETEDCTTEDDMSEDCITEETDGYNMVLIGNSFFRPYAEKLDDLAIEAGFENHNSIRITRGGDNGRPINFWNDSSSNEHQQIKAALDQGNIDFFGMTAGHEPEDRTEGHRAWIDYALQNNPNITIFIAIPQIDFPADWNQRAQEFGFDSIQELNDFFVNDLVHDSMVNQLRVEFPATKIFTIPTGQASFSLDQMNEDNELLDDITRFGPQESSLFTDDKGHQGDIIREAGGLLWLSSIYNVDLSTFDYETGFNTDLHAVAEDIMNNHNANYKLCFEQNESDQPKVKCESTYSVIVEEDITYAEGLSHDGISNTPVAMPQKLDIYYPDNNSTNRPVYLFIHGGGFQGGTKTKPEIIAMANYFASRGWVFASVDYRTTSDLGGNNFTGIAPQEWIDFTLQNASTPNDAKTSFAMYAAQRDAKAALRWMVANASTYNINTDFITVGGASAGAITTIALGISNQEDFRDEIPTTEDPTLSTTNLNETYAVRSLVDLWGSNTKLDLFGMVYGVERYDSNDPELFIAHGTEDPTVLFSEAEEMIRLYDSTGVHAELFTLEGQGHGAWGATVDGKSLSDLSFDFLVAQQEFILDCDGITSTSIENPNQLIRIFPNPVQNWLQLEIDSGVTGDFRIYDIAGKELFKREIISTTSIERIPIRHLKAGVYFLKFKTTSGLIFTHKFIKA